jgi:hypothetical protein
VDDEEPKLDGTLFMHDRDIFGFMRCECGEQLHKALQLIERGKRMLVYLIRRPWNRPDAKQCL